MSPRTHPGGTRTRRVVKDFLVPALMTYLVGGCVAASEGGQPGSQVQPWEAWKDLGSLSVIHRGAQSLLRSSHCPDGCRFDRHSTGHWRYLYVDGTEGVIFEETGPGAVTRLWMTMGQGVSWPLDPAISLRIYLDGAATPTIDVPITALFDGSTPPFEPPLVGGRLESSGGNFSYVPIPYREGCRIVLVGAHDKRIWFQINYQRVDSADGIVTFTGNEDLTPFVTLLSKAGSDPWPPGSGRTWEGQTVIPAGEGVELWHRLGSGTVNELELEVDSAYWPELELRLTFDGETMVAMPLADFFAQGRIGAEPTRSLLVGQRRGLLYSYFPMPFFSRAEIALENPGSDPVGVAYRLRADDRAPDPRSGLFGATLSSTPATEPGSDFALFSLTGEGRLAGSFWELGALGSPVRDYLEGDERLFIDHSLHPAVYGTGVEDYFNGGFYFDRGPFSMALHGAPYTELDVGGWPTTAAYRLTLTDGITFASHLRAGLESGPTNNLSMRVRAVHWFYLKRVPRLYLWDRFEPGLESEREAHGYEVGEPFQVSQLTASFEGEPPQSASGTGVVRPVGIATFELRAPPGTSQLRLRRRYDAGLEGQRASLVVEGQVAVSFPPHAINLDRRWREVDVDLGLTAGVDGLMELAVVAETSPTGAEEFSAYRYELWGAGPAGIFSDGFEAGGVAAWSTAAP